MNNDMQIEFGGGNRSNNSGKKLMKNNSMLDDRISLSLTRVRDSLNQGP